nr:hypothetical protein [Tanacetum cinerariifolium]
MGKSLNASLVVTESNGTVSGKQDESSRSGNDTDTDDVDIRPIYDEEPMAEVKCKYVTRNTEKGRKNEENMDSYETLRRNTYDNHGFVGYPFDYRVTLGFGSIAGGIDHVNTVTRLPLEHRISMEDGESLFHTCERYNDLLIKYPFHDHQKVSTFYNCLKGQTRRVVDSNGLIPGLTALEVLKSIQELADHSHKWQNEKNAPT